MSFYCLTTVIGTFLKQRFKKNQKKLPRRFVKKSVINLIQCSYIKKYQEKDMITYLNVIYYIWPKNNALHSPNGVKHKLPCPKLNIHSFPKISHPTVDFLWFPGYWLSIGEISRRDIKKSHKVTKNYQGNSANRFSYEPLWQLHGFRFLTILSPVSA